MAMAKQYAAFQQTYWNEPRRFAHECMRWRPGEGPSFYQDEILDAVPREKRVCVRGPHGLGKTADVSWLVHWFALTRDGLDWKIVTTASVWRQLDKFLWPEIHKWGRMLDWRKIGRPPYRNDELFTLKLRLRTGEAFAVASDNPAHIEGAHADHIMYIFDESKSVMDATFDAAEGALSTGCRDGKEAFAVAISTPGTPIGRFFEIQSRKPGLTDWWVRHVTLQETIRAGRVSAEWAEARREQWGEDSATYRNRVLGEFAEEDENALIRLSWVEQANERWQQLQDEGGFGDMTHLGVDVARFGADKSVIAVRCGNAISRLDLFAQRDTMQVTGLVTQRMPGRSGIAIVDVIGIGAGVVDRLNEQGYQVAAFNASERSDWTDRSGELHFVNKRAAAWWNLRELLEAGEIALPPDDYLTGELTSLQYEPTSSGRIKLASKDDVKKVIKRSTDRADAVVMAFWDDDPGRAYVHPW